MDELDDLYFIKMENELNQITREIIRNLPQFFDDILEELPDLVIEFSECYLPDYIIKGDVPDIEINDFL